jgi:hypothetical protein
MLKGSEPDPFAAIIDKMNANLPPAEYDLVKINADFTNFIKDNKELAFSQPGFTS